MKIAAFLRNLSTACVLTLLAATAAVAAGPSPLIFKDIMVEISTDDLLGLQRVEAFVPRPQFDGCVDFNAPFCIKEIWQETWVACVQPFGQEKLVAYSCGALRTVTRRCVDREWQEEHSYANDNRYCIESPADQSLCSMPGIVRSQDIRISSSFCS